MFSVGTPPFECSLPERCQPAVTPTADHSRPEQPEWPSQGPVTLPYEAHTRETGVSTPPYKCSDTTLQVFYQYRAGFRGRYNRPRTVHTCSHTTLQVFTRGCSSAQSPRAHRSASVSGCSSGFPCAALTPPCKCFPYWARRMRVTRTPPCKCSGELVSSGFPGELVSTPPCKCFRNGIPWCCDGSGRTHRSASVLHAIERKARLCNCLLASELGCFVGTHTPPCNCSGLHNREIAAEHTHTTVQVFFRMSRRGVCKCAAT